MDLPRICVKVNDLIELNDYLGWLRTLFAEFARFHACKDTMQRGHYNIHGSQETLKIRFHSQESKKCNNMT
jgi:hypothetical protein